MLILISVSLFPILRNFSFFLLVYSLFFFACSSFYSVTTPWRRQPLFWVLVQRTFTSSKQMKGKQAKAMAVISESFKCSSAVLTNLFECNWKSFTSVSLRGKMIPEELEKQVQRARKEVRGGEKAWRREEECMQTVCLCLSERKEN